MTHSVQNTHKCVFATFFTYNKYKFKKCYYVLIPGDSTTNHITV